MQGSIADTVLGSGFGAGFGLTWVGLCYILFRGRVRWVAAAVGGVGLAVGLAAVLDPSCVPIAVCVFVAAAAAVFAGPAAVRRGAEAFTPPAIRWAAAALLGLAAAGGSAAYYDSSVEEESDVTNLLTASVAQSTPLVPRGGTPLTTDRGTIIPARVPITPRTAAQIAQAERDIIGKSEMSWDLLRTGSADDRSNCHGWVFAAGQAWIGGSAVDTILGDNGYCKVSDPKPGDVVVYRSGNQIEHTAVVRYCSANEPPLVEGKWGALGVYLHRPHTTGYGPNFEYYRSPRQGHTVRGALSSGVIPNE